MEITEVRVKLMDDDSGERLKGFCSITFDDCFVIRDLKIIEGTHGPFVAMPSRKLTAHCPGCRCKNHLRAAFCNQCGRELSDISVIKDDEGRSKLYADIAHPINSDCREMIQRQVIEEFNNEVELAKQSGYQTRYEDPDVVYSSPQGKQTHIERAEAGPQGPHQLPDNQPVDSSQSSNESQQTDSRNTDSRNEDKDSGFGAGVFE